MAASNGSEYFELEINATDQSFSRPSNAELVARDAQELLWAAIERLPSQKQSNFALLTRNASEISASESDDGFKRTETIDVRKLNKSKRELVVKKALATEDQDNFNLLSGIKERLDR